MTRNAKVFACWYQSQHKGADVMPQDIINYKWIPWNPWMIGSDQCDDRTTCLWIMQNGANAVDLPGTWSVVV